MDTSNNSSGNFPDWAIEKWQDIANILAEIIRIPAVLIMRKEDDFMKVFISSQSENNPYQVDHKELCYGLYCETVIKTQKKLKVKNAINDKKWDKNPDIKLGMIAYLGFPLNFPDNQPFGTICVLDNKERPFTLLNEKLIRQFKNVIELDLALLQSFDLKTSQLTASIIQETHNRKLAEEALLVAKEKAEESDRLKSAFLANMSHEIRTPLNSIIGFSELLFDSDFEFDQKQEFITHIILNGNNLLNIISDIIDISKIEAGEITIRESKIQVIQFLNEIKSLHSIKVNQKNLKFNLACKCSPEVRDGIYFRADIERLFQVFNNLLGNALKFTAEGSIEIGCNSTENQIEFYVKDTGIGISPEYHDRIFERFCQIETPYSRKFGGNGLGLAICEKLINLMDGKIWVESELGNGATFYFTLPISN